MRYGQSITYGPLSAPALFTGSVERYSYGLQATKQLISGPAAIDSVQNHLAMVLHSKKASLSFTAKITSDSSDFLDLSAGAQITVSGISTGVVLARRAVERWRLMQPKTATIEATHYPDMTATGTGPDTVNAVSPALSTLILPSEELVYSTYGLSMPAPQNGTAAGIVHELEISQSLDIQEDEPSPDGKILGASAEGYERTISLLLLATGDIPAVGTTLSITGAPDHAADYRITSARLDMELQRGKMYAIEAAWIPGFTVVEEQ